MLGTWREGGLLVGVATVVEFLLDNVSTAYAQVEVHPDHRRRARERVGQRGLRDAV